MNEVNDSLSFQVDKFTFHVATDRKYSAEGVWIKQDGSAFVLGITDYLQQRSGDVAFIEVKPAGAHLTAGDEFAILETIKVNLSLSSPVTGMIIEVNSRLESSPEIVNQEPYAAGWLAVMEGNEVTDDFEHLMDAQEYFTKIKLEAEQDAR